MSAGSADWSLRRARAPEPVHITIVKVNTTVARFAVIAIGSNVADCAKEYSPLAKKIPGIKPNTANSKAS